MRIALPAEITKRLNASPWAYRLAHGAAWSLLGSVISRGLMLIAYIAVARLLGKEGFGEFGIIQSTVAMFGILTGFGLGQTATRFVAELRLRDPARAGRIIALSEGVAAATGAIGAFFFLIAAPWLASHALAAPHLTNVLRLGSLLLLFGAMQGAQTGVLSGFEAFRAITIISIATGATTFVLTCTGAWYGGVMGTVLGQSIGLGVNVMVNHWQLRRIAAAANVCVSYRDCRREWSVLWTFSLPATLCGAIVTPVMWVGNALLVNQKMGYNEMGLFNAANQWRTAILFLPIVFAQPFYPVLASIAERAHEARFKKILGLCVLGTTATALIPGIVVICLAGLIMRAYGASFDDKGSVLILIVTATVLAAPTVGLLHGINARNRAWHAFYLTLGWAISFLASLAVFSRRGAQGLAWAYVISYAAQLLLFGAYAIRFAGRVRGRHCERPDAASLAVK